MRGAGAGGVGCRRKALVRAVPVHVRPELTRPYTSRPSFLGACNLAADVYRAGYTSRPSLQGASKLGAHVYGAGTHGRTFGKKPQTRARRVPSLVEPCQLLLDVYQVVR